MSTLVFSTVGMGMAFAQEYKGKCVHNINVEEELDKCSVNISGKSISIAFKSSKNVSANQTVNIDAITSISVEEVKKTTAERALFYPIWAKKQKFLLFTINYQDTEASEKQMQFRFKRDLGGIVQGRLEQATSQNVEIISAEEEEESIDEPIENLEDKRFEGDKE